MRFLCLCTAVAGERFVQLSAATLAALGTASLLDEPQQPWHTITAARLHAQNTEPQLVALRTPPPASPKSFPVEWAVFGRQR